MWHFHLHCTTLLLSYVVSNTLNTVEGPVLWFRHSEPLELSKHCKSWTADMMHYPSKSFSLCTLDCKQYILFHHSLQSNRVQQRWTWTSIFCQHPCFGFWWCAGHCDSSESHFWCVNCDCVLPLSFICLCRNTCPLGLNRKRTSDVWEGKSRCEYQSLNTECSESADIKGNDSL